ncbi:hypothetical protein EJ06DRAFT_368591 [Trichodelitschia bisporula]|uniref:Uncharacterized protein n=1 Tax=Trichodelitschia bisporula TaxID=703511 RepID=A0A6G1I167_9PEZI|nr:hypothetical protein EJ06DRAFT_368591 [Trichodelitschia bisporula]
MRSNLARNFLPSPCSVLGAFHAHMNSHCSRRVQPLDQVVHCQFHRACCRALEWLGSVCSRTSMTVVAASKKQLDPATRAATRPFEKITACCYIAPHWGLPTRRGRPGELPPMVRQARRCCLRTWLGWLLCQSPPRLAEPEKEG